MTNVERLLPTAVQIAEDLKGLGYTHSFRYGEGHLLCVESERRYTPEQLQIDAYFRFEGPSNPDDESILIAVRAGDGTRGIFMDAFGPQADPHVAEFCTQMRDAREQAGIMESVPAAKEIVITTSPKIENQKRN